LGKFGRNLLKIGKLLFGKGFLEGKNYYLGIIFPPTHACDSACALAHVVLQYRWRGKSSHYERGM